MNVYVSSTLYIDTNVELSFGVDPELFNNPGVQDSNIASAYTLPEADPVEMTGAFSNLAFDPDAMACVSLSPIPPFDYFFDYTVDNVPGTIFVEAHAPPGQYVMVGDIDDPTPLFEITWDVAPWEVPGEITEVKVESCEFMTSIGSMHSIPHRTAFWLGEPPPEPPEGTIPTVSTWGLIILALLLLTTGKLFWRRAVRVSFAGNHA